MSQNWFYAVDNTQRGPVSAGQLCQLEADGTLQPGSLVWREGWEGWQPWSLVASEVRSAAGGEGDTGICAYTGRTLPRSELVRYGEHWVAQDSKDAFVQSLREGQLMSDLPGTGLMRYVGFWWRVLASSIDWAVKLIPTQLMMVPYYVLSFRRAAEARSQPSFNPLDEFKGPEGTAILIAYAGGMLGYVIMSIVYETWLVGRYGGTVGKLALNFRVVNPDGSRVSYRKAFGRWAAESVSKIIWFAPSTAAILIGVSSLGANPEAIGPAFGVAILLMALWFIIGGFPYYMAGWNREKKALHDIMASTRVIHVQPRR